MKFASLIALHDTDLGFYSDKILQVRNDLAKQDGVVGTTLELDNSIYEF
jgi:hypothetical protein